MNRRRFLLAGLAATAALGAAAPAYADTPAPMSPYKRVSRSGEFVFVMLDGPWPGPRITDPWDGYPRSGLYRNDGSRNPLWTVDWYAYNVDVASDGVHLVRQGDLAMDMYGLAAGFYANGEPTRLYRIIEVVADESKIGRSVTFLHWKLDGRYNESRTEYVLRTRDGKVTVFDVTTGAIVSQTRPGIIHP